MSCTQSRDGRFVSSGGVAGAPWRTLHGEQHPARAKDGTNAGTPRYACPLSRVVEILVTLHSEPCLAAPFSFLARILTPVK